MKKGQEEQMESSKENEQIVLLRSKKGRREVVEISKNNYS